MTGASCLAVDWGTSSLRAALLAADGTVLGERANARGILTVPADGFEAVLRELCADWLRDAPVCVIGGMAGSRQGWREAPYVPCPAGFEQLGAELAWVVPERIGIVPGVSCEEGGVPDVMRGEEVQVFGAADLLGLRDTVCVLPGTHSKWVELEAGRIARFATFMAGECFALLRQHSILARTLPAGDDELDEDAFLRGVDQARSAGSLLRSAFSVRTLALFDRMPPAALPSYLSGLVIGEELRARAPAADRPVVLIGTEALTRRYALALGHWGVPSRRVGHEATWRGLSRIAAALP